jgi:hypothetical protein
MRQSIVYRGSKRCVCGIFSVQDSLWAWLAGALHALRFQSSYVRQWCSRR